MLDIVKSYLKVDGGESDSVLSLLVSNAEEYLLNSGVLPLPQNKQYQTAVCVHVLLHFENFSKDLNVKSLEQSLQTIVLQLKSYGGGLSEEI